jgi:hypothetical protein
MISAYLFWFYRQPELALVRAENNPSRVQEKISVQANLSGRIYPEPNREAFMMLFILNIEPRNTPTGSFQRHCVF